MSIGRDSGCIYVIEGMADFVATMGWSEWSGILL